MYLTIKYILNYIALLLVVPVVIVAKIGLAMDSERLYLGCAQFLALAPGLGGVFLRRGFYRVVLSECSWDVVIEFGTYFSHPLAELESGVCIGAFCILGQCRVGAETHIASHVSILSGRHQHGMADRDAGTFQHIFVGRECWIGERSVVMANLGEHCSIGAGSVVVKDIPANTVAVGNPAQVKA